MLILDTSVWVAFLNRSDSQHKKASKYFQSLKEKYILVEILNVLILKVNRDKANAFLEMALNSQDIEIFFNSRTFSLNLIRFFIKNRHKKLSFVNQSLLYLSKNYTVLTFDKALAKLL